jgi:ornithine carbamoyltransferase
VTLKKHFGDLSGRHVLYIGEGNSTAASLVHATALTPDMRLTLLTPARYGLGDASFELAARLGDRSGRIVQRHRVSDRSGPFDAVYTSRWQTMGVRKAGPGWLAEFQPFRVTRELFEWVREEHTVFVHDLPAIRGQEVTDSVLGGPESLVWRQAFHKMTGAMAVLEWCALTGGQAWWASS